MVSSRTRILVCGGRKYPHKDRVWKALDAVLRKHPNLVVVHGACPTGADRWAALWVRDHLVAEERHPADWQVHGRRAGPIRNQQMVDSGLDGAIAFEGGRGTEDMVTRLYQAEIPIWWPDGGDIQTCSDRRRREDGPIRALDGDCCRCCGQLATFACTVCGLPCSSASACACSCGGPTHPNTLSSSNNAKVA